MTANYKERGGSRNVIGGSLDVISGGDLDIESGASLKLAGTAISATAAEINELAGRENVLALAHTVTKAEYNAGHTLITAVAGKQIRVLDFKMVSAGNVTQATALVLQDTADTPVVVTTVAAAALTNGTVVFPSSANVTNGAGFLVALTADKGLTIISTGTDESTATSVAVYVTYSYV